MPPKKIHTNVQHNGTAARLASLSPQQLVEGVYAVLMGTYCTVDFSKAGDVGSMLYSDDLSACVALVIKNKSSDTGKYDNVVTMAHFYPPNAKNPEITEKNVQAILADYKEKGGKLNANTSIQLFGGIKNISQDPSNSQDLSTVREVILGALNKDTDIKGAECKLKEKGPAWDLDVEGGFFGEVSGLPSTQVYIVREGTLVSKKMVSTEGGV